MPQSSPTDSTTEDDSRPRSITDVLCREVGAPHPDGALRQIRTMKRLLRSHYRVQQRLEQYGVESLEDAVSRIADLTQQVERMRTRQRQRARQRLTIIESLLAQMNSLRFEASSRASLPNSGSPSASESPSAALQTALDLVDALATELDELRLDLWVYQSDDPTSSASEPDTTTDDLLGRLNESLQTAQQTITRLHKEHKALQEENDRLQRETKRLRQTVQKQQQRIEQLEREGPQTSPLTPADQ